MGIKRTKKFIKDQLEIAYPKPTCLDMELALTAFQICCRRNCVIPNVFWSMFRYEIDLLVVTKAGYAWEIEIKVSKADLIKDKEKNHTHNDRKISRLYFAIPTHLMSEIHHIPEHAGIFEIYHVGGEGRIFNARLHREARFQNEYKFSKDEINELYRLGALRIWTLKRNLKKYQDEKIKLKQAKKMVVESPNKGGSDGLSCLVEQAADKAL